MNLTEHHLGTFLLTGFDKSISDDFKDAFCDKFDLLEAGSADEAIELLKAQPVDLLIVDQDLPKTNLTKLLEKSSAEFSNVRRLLCSDSSRADEMNEYLKNGLIHGSISKPVTECNFNEQIEGMFMPIPGENASIPSDDPDFASLLKADAEIGRAHV
jgi:DNA-binding NarL/FixJ family response regulator